MTEAPASNELEPAEPASGEEDAELDAAAIAALLRGGDPGDGAPRAPAHGAKPTPATGSAEPAPAAPAPSLTPADRDAQAADEFLIVELTPVDPEEPPPGAVPAQAAPVEEPAAEVVAPEPAAGPSWLGGAARGLRDRWTVVPARAARLATGLRAGAASLRRALARAVEKRAPAPGAPAAAARAPARGSGALAGSGVQPRVARLVLASLFVNTAAMGALLGVLFLLPLGEAAPAVGRSGDHAAARALPAPERRAPPGPILRLGEFVVLLHRGADGADRRQEQYARITFAVELPDEATLQAANSRLPLLRDAILSYLSDCTAEDLRGSEALKRVKDALALRFSRAAPRVPFRAVYLSDLVVQ